MKMSRLIRRCAAAAVAAVAIVAAGLTAATPSVAAGADFDFSLPAGQACADFGLRIIGVGDSRQVREFRNGSVISAGKGFTLTFINLDNTGKTLTLQSNGSVEKKTSLNPPNTVQLAGHNVIILFPTDITPGPSTTLYVGSVVYTADANNNFTILSHSGRTTDICAALS
jgi:hypothetical protein